MKSPGEILQEYILKSGMSRKELAIRTGVTEKHICTVINDKKGISINFAKKLGYVFENTEFWIDVQSKYDAFQLQIKEENEIDKEEFDVLNILQEVVEYFIQKGYMHNNCGNASKIVQLRSLLGVSNLTVIPKIQYCAAYRAQVSSNISINPYIVFAWQKLCEIQTENLEIQNKIDINKLNLYIPRIKGLMFDEINDGIKELQLLLAECGIAFQVVRNFRGAPVQGFIKQISNSKLILCMTIRGRRADVFWFTLFHEIGHIINGDYKEKFVDFSLSVDSSSEKNADEFASEILIPKEKYEEFILQKNCVSWSAIEDFAQKINVESFVVLGRLQRDGILDWTDYTDKVKKYSWA